MAEVLKSASKIGWSTKTQSAFGTGLAKTDLTLYLTLQDPLIINDAAELYTNTGQIGTGHEWPTYRGVRTRMVTIDIPVQPMDIDFAGMLVCLGLGEHATTGAGDNKTHKAEWEAISSQADAKVTSITILEDGNEKLVQDVAVSSFTIRGEGSNRMEMGASLVATKLGSDLTSYTYPVASTPDYVWNSAGVFSLDSDIKTQLLSFELNVTCGIDMSRAWNKVATEAARSYASCWPYSPHPARGLTWTCKIRAESGNIATYRAAQLAGTEIDLDVSWLGTEIPTDTGDYYELAISMPKAVITDVGQDYGSGFLDLTLSGDANYDSTEGSPLAISVVNAVTTYLTAAS